MTSPLEAQILSCTICSDHLPLGPKPIFRLHPEARIALISQAPGRVAHQKGIPWLDQSGNRLRDWLGVDMEVFYESSHFAVLPMGMCYPGKGKSGDLPPRKECAPEWHALMWRLMPNIQLRITIGQYAQLAYLTNRPRNLTETVRRFEQFLPGYFPLPHPSPLNGIWLRKNPWFASDVLPVLRRRVASIIN